MVVALRHANRHIAELNHFGKRPRVIKVGGGLAVAEAGVEQERFERFVQRRIAEGASVVGLYPPDDATREEYQRWLDAGEGE